MVVSEEENLNFKRFGILSFTSISKLNDFMNYLVDGKVAGTKCDICGRYFFPPRFDCSVCLSSRVKWFIVNSRGNLISYTRLKFAPKGFEKDLPYIVGLLDFNNYKVFGRIDSNIGIENVKIGMHMKILVKKSEKGQYYYTFNKV